MPFRVKIQAEPFTRYSWETIPILAISNEYRRLYRDLERYTLGQISGRSYLIAGHRGSGKTMLVYKAIEDLTRDCKGKPYRPLFIRLHGPDLLPPEVRPVASSTAKPNNGGPTANQIAIAFSGDSPASVTTAERPGAATTTDAEMVNVLTQMMKCLFREVSEEFRKRFRKAAFLHPPGLKRQKLLEIAGQLDLEIADSANASRLRSFWHRMDVLGEGVLFPPFQDLPEGAAAYDPTALAAKRKRRSSTNDAGVQEILVLSFLSQAYQVISGTIEEKQKQSEASKNQNSSTINAAYEVKNLLAPLAGLLTGGFVGAQIGAQDPFYAVLLGLLTGAVVSFGVGYSSSRSKTREQSVESVFIKDRSVASLSGVLPVLVQRIRAIGLAPIFVIDELDKVQGLENRMQKLVKHLKFLVTENSFTCFLTDRRYLAYLNRQASQFAYAREYTYFSDHLLVLYHPEELREFVRKAIEVVPEKPIPAQQLPPAPAQPSVNPELEKIAYVLLFRARMHPIDLRRQIDSLAGRLSFSMADSFTSPRSRFEILMQVAIEWLLDGDDVQARISGNPYYRQVVYDALYYVSRLWEDAGADEPRIPGFKEFGTPDDQKPGLELDKEKFSAYIESRSALEDPQPPKEAATVELPGKPAEDPLALDSPAASDASVPPGEFAASDGTPAASVARVSGKDFEFLFGKVEELLTFLCKPQELISEIERSPRQIKPPDFILLEIPKTAALRLLIRKPDKSKKKKENAKYRWLYDVSGRSLQPREVDIIIDEVGDQIAYIREVMAGLNQVGMTGDLHTMAEARIIPRPSEWKEKVLPALERLDRLSAEGNAYGNMDADSDAVLEFANTLDEYKPNLKAALVSAAIFAPEMSGSFPSPEARFAAALTHVSQLLQLTATAEEDLRKLTELLNSVPGGPRFAYEDPLDQVLNLAAALMSQPPVVKEESDRITESAWQYVKNRFSKRFHDGTAKFDAQYEDVFTSIKKAGPGHEVALDFSTVTVSAWTKLLLRALIENQVPGWLRVAAAVELDMPRMGERLLPSIHEDQARLEQWVFEALRKFSVQPIRRNILVLAVDEGSITQSWTRSTRHAALVTTVTDCASLVEELSKYEISQPADYPIDLVAVELAGDRKHLGRLITMKPQSAISDRLSKGGPTLKAIDPFLELPDICYIVNETPATTTPDSPVPRVIVAPKGFDDIVERLVSIDYPTST